MTMKIGIDSYCFHRFFGEVYPEQPQPPKSMTLEDFIELAKKLNVNGVSLESCFIPQREDAGYMANIKALLDESNPLRRHLQEVAPYMRMVLMGLILVLMLRFRPKGILPEEAPDRY